MGKRKYIYCWNCGIKNKIVDKKCMTCKKKLLDEDKDELGAFIIDKLVGEGKDEAEKKLKEKFRDFVSKKFFGILLSASVAFTGSTVIATILEKTKEPQEILTLVQSHYTFEAMLEAHEEKCEEAYALMDGECFRELNIPAEKKLSCESNFILRETSCLQEIEKEEVKECILPSDFVYSGDACSPLKISYNKNTNGIFPSECLVSANEWVTTIDEDGNETKTCSNGGVVNFIDPTISYRCPSNSSERNGKCYNISKPNETFTCKEGTLSGKNCIITEKGLLSAQCDEGYEYNEIVKLCIKK